MYSSPFSSRLPVLNAPSGEFWLPAPSVSVLPSISGQGDACGHDREHEAGLDAGLDAGLEQDAGREIGIGNPAQGHDGHESALYQV